MKLRWTIGESNWLKIVACRACNQSGYWRVNLVEIWYAGVDNVAEHRSIGELICGKFGTPEFIYEAMQLSPNCRTRRRYALSRLSRGN